MVIPYFFLGKLKKSALRYCRFFTRAARRENYQLIDQSRSAMPLIFPPTNIWFLRTDFLLLLLLVTIHYFAVAKYWAIQMRGESESPHP
jgi:hypothetical protein